MDKALRRGGTSNEIRAVADQIRMDLNPHPEGQLTHNVPTLGDGDGPVAGVQHKYSQTCLVFPSAGQTCHAFCTFCFRWAQFVGMPGLKFATDEAMRFREYLRRHHEITDVLFTGGDPMVMKTEVLTRYIEPLLTPEFEHIQTIRIGTKSLSYWPHRYLTDPDADDLLRLCERVTAAGRHLAIMAHFNHWREFEPEPARLAISRLRSAGAVIRTQSPLVRHINDDGVVWARMWKDQVRLGCIPYYMFIERDTGPKGYFQVPLSRALEIYREAIARGSGLARTARGPTMSALPGKVVIEGVAEVAGEQVFVLSLLQARDPSWCKQPFFARFDPSASWLDNLRPAFGANEFFYEQSLRTMLATTSGSDEFMAAYPTPAMPMAMAM
jgi:KamA family protein